MRRSAESLKGEKSDREIAPVAGGWRGSYMLPNGKEGIALMA